MKKMVICRVCGYVMAEDDLGNLCPACGVAKTAFQPFEDKVSAKRRRILNLHLHSMFVHFPQAFAVFVFFLAVAVLVLNDPLREMMNATLKVLIGFLPFTVLAGLFSGIVDGKTRFRTLSTPLLKVKISLAAAFLLISAVMAIDVLLKQDAPAWLVVSGSGLCALIAVLLGGTGGKLACREVNG